MNKYITEKKFLVSCCLSQSFPEGEDQSTWEYCHSFLPTLTEETKQALLHQDGLFFIKNWEFYKLSHLLFLWKKKKRYRNVWLHKTKLPHIHPLCLYNFKVFPFCREWEPLWLMWVFFPCFFSTSRTNYAIKISIKDGTSIQNTYSD